MIGFEYRAPEALDEVCAQLGELGDEARVIAGGTALVLLMKQRLVQPAVILSLRRLAELRQVGLAPSAIRIGATATHRQVETNQTVRQQLPVLAETLRRVATPRVRNQGTLGGNLAHADPNQDPPPTLLALDAAVTLRSSHGERTLPLSEFFVDYYETALQPDEVLTTIEVPLPAPGSACSFLKFLPRTSDDYATVAVATRVRLENDVCQGVRIALGAVGPTPLRARAAEELLEGERPGEQSLRTAAAAVRDVVEPLSDVRGSAEYKRDMAEVFTYRALRQALSTLDSAESA